LATLTRLDGLILAVGLAAGRIAAGLKAGGLGGGAGAMAERFRTAGVVILVPLLVAWPWLAAGVWYRLAPVAPGGLVDPGGGGVPSLAVVLFEYLTVILPIPETWESVAWIRLAAGLIVLLVLIPASVREWFESDAAGKGAVKALGAFVVLLAVAYGLTATSGDALSRQLAPASPLLALAGAAIIFRLWDVHRPVWFTVSFPLLVFGLLLGYNIQLHVSPAPHPQRAMVQWVQDHPDQITSQTPVAAVHSGTLGFYHPPTVPLNPEVNADLASLRGAPPAEVTAGLIDYLAHDQTGVPYVFDAPGVIGSWSERTAFGRRFEEIGREETPPPGVLVYARRSPADAGPTDNQADDPQATERKP